MQKLALFLFAIFALIFLAACDGLAAPDIYTAGAQADGTLLAVHAYQTGTAQAQNERAQAATLSAAQTQDSHTATAQAVTRQAESDRATSTAQAAATATAIANAEATQGAEERISASQTAWPPTAEALQKTQSAADRAEKIAALQDEWQGIMTPLKPILMGAFWICLVLFLFIGAVVLYRRFAPDVSYKLRTFTTPDGEVVIALPASTRINVIQPKRNLGAGLVAGPDGIKVAGIPEIDGRPALPAQAGVVARLQAGQAFHYLPPGPAAEDVKGDFILKTFEGENAPALPVETPHIEIIDPGDTEIHQIWGEVQQKLLLGNGEK